MRARNNCERTSWNGRAAFRLRNGVVELTVLPGGGFVAEFRFAARGRLPGLNVLWQAPWPTIDPHRFGGVSMVRRYGPPPVGRFLSGFTGHAVCLDYFGMPSPEEANHGLALHGEAPAARWRQRSGSSLQLTLEARLPLSGLAFRRGLRLLPGESVVYVREEVRNLRPTDHFFHWVQHATFGPPFLGAGESLVALPGTHGMTWPQGYEGKSLLAADREFRWPCARGENRALIDLSRPFVRRGKGFVAAILSDPVRRQGYIAVLNWRLGLVAGYCFPRNVFPWIAIWEENCARTGSPWNGRTQARGLEFGTTPLPVGKREAFAMGSLFGVPTCCCVAAKGTLRAGYLLFLAAVSKSWRAIHDVRVEGSKILIEGGTRDRVEVPARGLKKLGW